jgi:hypothetical protein
MCFWRTVTPFIYSSVFTKSNRKKMFSNTQNKARHHGCHARCCCTIETNYIYIYAKLFSQCCSGIEDTTDTEEEDLDKTNQIEVPDQVDCPTSFENQ